MSYDTKVSSGAKAMNMHLVARQATVEDFGAMMSLCRVNGEPEATNLEEWNALWRSDSTVGVVVDDITAPSGAKARALMVGVYISDAFLQECIASEDPFILAKIAKNPSALVPAGAFGAMNAGDGLNLLVAYMGWIGDEYHAFPGPNLRAVVVSAFADRHGGNRLKWLLGEVGGPRLLDLTSRAGCQILNDYPKWAHGEGGKRYYLMGLSREAAMQVENQWITRMFTYFVPHFHFTESQRTILVLAREGHTDAEIGEQIGVSPDAVKKRWGAIYARVAEVFPSLLPESPLGGRGAEKRRALLMHLRERPEELRPYDRRVGETRPGR